MKNPNGRSSCSGSRTDHKGLGSDDQKKAMFGGSVMQGVNTVKSMPAFRKMMDSNSRKALLEAALKGKGSITDKFITAKNSLPENQGNARKPKDMTNAEKHEIIMENTPVLQ